jgi:pimeloyl-ACP methyl ester carboxylesterase
MSLIGWSLGGIYAREVAKRISTRVRGVITIGTPFAGSPHQTHAGTVYRLVNGSHPVMEQGLMRRMGVAPPAPTTSIYTRSDGVVAWQACLQSGTRRTTENVEVDGSHCGLPWNPSVLAIVADRLAQPEHGWQTFGVRARV